MGTLWHSMLFSANIILPLVALLWAGRWLCRSGQISRAFINDTNNLLYRHGIPGLLFFGIVKSEVSILSEWRAIAAGYVATLALFFASSWVARGFIDKAVDRGVFVQGVFRGNLAIVGLAFVSSTYGDYGLAVGSVLVGLIAFLLNVLAVICLEQAASKEKIPLSRLFAKMFDNPLIVAIILAVIVKLIHFPVPEMVIRFGDLYTRITLPLALILTGAGCNFNGIFRAGQMAIWASIGRLIISPLCFLGAGLLFGLGGRDLGILGLLGAAPAATAGYVMARALGGNEVAAANIIAITTAASLIVVAPLIVLFQLFA